MTAALILAGGEVKEKYRPTWQGLLPDGVWNRALLDLNGKTMLERVVAPVREAVAGRVLVAGDVPTPEGCVAVPGGESMVDTILHGLAALAPEEDHLLLVTADIPFVTADALRDLIDHAPDCDFVYPIVPAQLCFDAFPEMRRTTLRTAEGTFTGGNVVLVKPAFLRRNEVSIRHAYDQRKNLIKLAAMLGPGVVGRVLLSRAVPGALPIAAVERAVGRLLGGADVRAYISPHPGIGSDVDHPEDVPLARRLLGDV